MTQQNFTPEQFLAQAKPFVEPQQVQSTAEGVPKTFATDDGAGKGADEEPQRRRTWRQQLIDQSVNDALFKDAESKTYALVQRDTHREFHLIRSRNYRALILSRFFVEHQAVPPSQPIEETLSFLDGKALADGKICDPTVRIGKRNDAIFIDIGDDQHRAIEISKSGYCVVPHPEALFIRRQGMLSLPLPSTVQPDDIAGTLSSFRRLTGIADDSAWLLVLSWLVAAFRDRGPYPILLIIAEQGSGKSTLSRMLRGLIDPNIAAIRSAPRGERDLVIAAKNSHLIAIDNQSSLSDELSDALCRLSTGGGLSTRKLYADDEEALFDVQRPILMNGISDFATRGDFLDRAILLSLRTIPETERRTEQDIMNDFEKLRPQLLSILCLAVSAALSRKDSLKFDSLPRLADFALFAMAAEEALGFTAGAFVAAYDENARSITALALESSPLAQAVFKWMESASSWEGPPAELLKKLNSIVDADTQRLNLWPKTAQTLSTQMRRISPPLRKLGIEVTFRRGHERLISLNRVERADASDAGAQSYEV